jgi:hypothetical protein
MAVWWPNQHGRAGVRSKMHEACGGRSDGAIQSEHCYQIPSLGEHRQRLLSTTGFSIFKDILILEGFGYCDQRSGPIDKSWSSFLVPGF